MPSSKKGKLSGPNNPAQLLRGSTVLLSGIDSFLSVENTKKTENLIDFTIKQEKLRQGKPNSPFKISLVEVEGKISFSWRNEIEAEDSKKENCKEAILSLLTIGEEYQTKIVEKLIPLYFAEMTIRRAIEELKENKEVKIRKGEQRRIYLSLP